jgi:uncharacterized protein YcbK (DUF882 family)
VPVGVSVWLTGITGDKKDCSSGNADAARSANSRVTNLDTEASRVRDLLIDAGYDSNGADVLDALARELLTLTQSERDAILPSMLAQIRAIRAVARR